MTETTAIIGASNGAPVALDLEALIGTHACAIANSGGGKSGLIRKIHEATHGMIQQILLDPEDDFYTLREKHDYVIAGGEDGDVPATLDNARALALASLTHGFSLIVQLNDLGADAPEFVNRFLDGLMSAPRELWHPVLVTIDELQRFASRDAGESIPAIKDLVFRGRKRGFTALFASLRMAEIDPGIRGMVNNWLLGRNGQALDRRTMADQLGFSAKDGREKLAAIDKRHFWAMGPAFSVEPVLFKVGDVETTPLRTGQARVATPPPPDALRGILAGLAVEAPAADVGERAEKSTDAPKVNNAVESQLRTRIAELEAERDDWTIERAYGQQQLDALIGERDELRRLIAAFTQDTARVAIALADEIPAEGGGGPAGDEGQTEAPKAPRAAPVRRRETQPQPAPAGVAVHAPAGTALPKSQQRVLDAIAWWGALGFSHIERRRACVIAGLSPKASTFGVYISKLAQAGLVDVSHPGAVGLTDDGKALATIPDNISKAQVVAEARGMLTTAAQNVFDRIVLAYPNWISRDALADECGLSRTASTLGVYISKAGALGFVETKPGQVRASDWLFP